MGKTAVERQRERRQRLKDNPRAYERYKKDDRIRKQNARKNMSPEELRKLKERIRLAVQKHRHPAEDEVEDGSDYKYGNQAALRKAKSRVLKALPSSPRKRRTILKTLACDVLGAYVVDVRRGRIPQEVIDAILAFYQDDAVSRMMPGKADYISIRDVNGKKVKKQKRHLIMTLSEAYQCFVADHPDGQIGKSKFASLRPKWVFLSSQMPQNVCGCRYHENVFLLLEALHRKYPEVVPLYSKDRFTAKCKYDPSNETCMSDNCGICSNAKLFNEHFRNLVTEEPVFKWYQWQDVDGYLQKAPVQGSTTEAFDDLASQLPKFFWHSYVKDKQAASYTRSKTSALEDGSNVCLLQMDFAENFTCLWQNEIQSAHWRQRQVSIYTVMVYHRGCSLSCVIVSDCREHEKCAVTAFTSQVLDVIKSEFPTVESIDIWSDGPSSQFKNRFIFAVLPKLEEHHGFRITWNYFATSHGKGPNDGLGGNVKRMAHRLIMTDAKMIQDAESFADGIRSCETNIQVLVMNQDSIEERCRVLGTEAIWEGLQPFQGTINTHSLQTAGENRLHLRYYSDAQEHRDIPIRYTQVALRPGPGEQNEHTLVADPSSFSPAPTTVTPRGLDDDESVQANMSNVHPTPASPHSTNMAEGCSSTEPSSDGAAHVKTNSKSKQKE